MNKRFVAALLALTMIVALLPATALAAPPTAVYVGSTDVTTGYETERSLYGGRVRYSAGVLTLSGVTVPNTASHENAAIYADGDLTIELTGTNTVTAPAAVTGESSGVRVVNGSLTIQGTGSLTARGGNTTGAYYSYGAYIYGKLTLTGGTLTGNGGISPEGNSYGVYVRNNIEVTGGALNGTSSTAGQNSFGVRSGGSIAVSGTGRLTGRSDSGNDCTGVLALTSITVTSGAQLTGHGGAASNKSRGIYCGPYTATAGTITLTGGVITVSGNTQAVNAQPVFSDTTQTNGNWYRWKENTTASEPADYTISSTTAQFTNDTSVKSMPMKRTVLLVLLFAIIYAVMPLLAGCGCVAPAMPVETVDVSPAAAGLRQEGGQTAPVAEPASVSTPEELYEYETYEDANLGYEVAAIREYIGPDVEELIVPDTLGGRPVTSIGWLAEIPSLVRVTIPSTVTEIKSQILFAPGLKEVFPADLLEQYPQGFVLNRGEDGDWSYTVSPIGAVLTCYSGTNTDVVLPDQLGGQPVIGMGAFAFGAVSGIKSVVVPESYASVCFRDCASLERATLPSNLNSIPHAAFSGCVALSEIALPNKLTAIGQGAFYGCTALTEVDLPDTLAVIGDGAFENCESLSKIDLPQGILSVGDNAFSGCRSLKSAALPEGLVSIGEGAFGGCDSLTRLSIPQSVIHIKASAFRACQSITSVRLPEGLVELGSGAFAECGALRDVTLPDNLTQISEYLFGNCRALQKIKLPQGITTIGKSAFSCCDLTSIEIPQGVCSIGEDAFSDNVRLRSIQLPKGVSKIPDRLFYGCEGLKTVTLPEGLLSVGEGAFRNCDALTNLVLPDSVASIGDSAFYGCHALKSVTLPKGLQSIGNEAFFYCENLKKLDLPDGLISIGDEAFLQCYKLSWLTIPDNVTKIGVGAFVNTAWLAKQPIRDGWITLGNHVRHVLVGCGDVVVPPEYVPFEFCQRPGFDVPGSESLLSVTVSDGIESIPARAFDDAPGLYRISLPDSLRSIGDSAFDDCGNLSSIRLPEGLQSIGEHAFEDCSGLRAVVIPNSVAALGKGAFAFCHWLADVQLSKGLTEIPDGAFTFCDLALTSVAIPASVTSINDDAFSKCTALSDIAFSEGLLKICPGAFSDCTSLTRVDLPRSLVLVDHNAFSGCTALTNVRLSRNTEVGYGAFPDTVQLAYYEPEEEPAASAEPAAAGQAPSQPAVEQINAYLTASTEEELRAALATQMGSLEAIYVDVEAPIALSAELTVPPRFHLRVIGGGSVTVPKGFTLTVEGVMCLWNAGVKIDGALMNKGDIYVGNAYVSNVHSSRVEEPGTLIIRGDYEDFGGLHAEGGGALSLYCGTIEGTDRYEKRG